MSDKEEEDLVELRDRFIHAIREEYAKRKVSLIISNSTSKQVTLNCDQGWICSENGNEPQQNSDHKISISRLITCPFMINLMYDGEKWTHEIVCDSHNHDISDIKNSGKRCGRCGDPGHNVRSCKSSSTQSDPVSPLLQTHKFDAAIADGRFMTFNRVQTKCKKCGKEGHNSRSCETNHLTPVTPIYMPTNADVNRMLMRKKYTKFEPFSPASSEKYESPPITGTTSPSVDGYPSPDSARPITKISQLLNSPDSSQAENQFSFKKREYDPNTVTNHAGTLWSPYVKKLKLMQRNIVTRQRCGVCGLPGHNSRKHDLNYNIPGYS